MSRAAVNICLTHEPALAGLYRAVNDFARALDAPVVSFDDGRHDRAALTERDGARRIACGPGWLARDCHVMPATAARAAAAALGAADLLIVHSLFRAHAPWAAAEARRRDGRYWSVPHGCLDPWGLSQRGLAKRAWLTAAGRAFLANAERIVFSTRRAREKARPWVGGQSSGGGRASGDLDGQSVVVHWPVEPPAAADGDAARERFRARHGIPHDRPLLLFVGRLHAVKRPLETVRAFCRAAGGEAHLAVVGIDGDVTLEDVRRAVPPACGGRVHACGPLEAADLADAYAASDAFISLSFQENFGYAAAEAVCRGLPVILSPGHDLAHELPRETGGERLACGWLLPDDSAAAAEQAIAEWVREAGGGAAGAARDAARGASGRAWATEWLSFARFRDTLRTLAG